jgi:16S rRNA G966 N2-methylase RsmD
MLSNILSKNKYSDLLIEEDIDENDSLNHSTENSINKYMKPTILENINLEKYFDRDDINKAVLNNKKLQITDKGLYSITKYYDAKWITDMIISFLKNKNINISKTSIIDGTAGIGGNTISFSKYFLKVYSIEINNVHYDVLRNNINALSMSNVEIYLDNFLNFINNDLKSNILFFDPPWGGKSYKNFKYFNLKIGKLSISTIINMFFDKKIKYIILKAPYNLNLSQIFLNIKYENMNIHANQKKNMLLCFFY